MPSTLDQVLGQRLHRISTTQRRRYVIVSVIGHAALVAAFFLLPVLFAEEPEPFDYVAVTVIPPQALGSEDPTPPPPPPPTPTPEPPPPEPPPPAPATKAPEPDRPILVDEKKPEEPKPKPAPPPPKPVVQPPPPAPPPPRAAAPPSNPLTRRRGSPIGDPLGSTSNTAIGVEDPNFTYGYYLDRVAAEISAKWTRPPVGGEVQQAVLYFRILSTGEVTDLRVADSSGDETFDRAARAAVEATSPLPPLPKSYKHDRLGINLIIR
ncbi:MAG: energy transducer TonB [Acidobacteriota bacterium]